MKQSQGPPNFWEELKRRRVVRVALAYAGGAFVVLQAADPVLDSFGMPASVLRGLVIAMAAGFPVVLLLSWLFDVTREGVRRTGGGGEGRLVARWHPRLALGGGAAAMLALLVVGLALHRPEPASAEVAPGADLIAVLPFHASGEGMQVLEQGMVDLLSRNLNEVGGVRTVDPRTILSRWGRRAQGGPLPLEEALQLAREVHAGSVLMGSVVAVGPAVRLSAELLGADGDRIASAEVDGDADQVLALIDRLSVELLRAMWRSAAPLPELDIRALTSSNLAALRAFLDGERYYRASHWDSALVAFREAVVADSAFPLAHFRLATTASWMPTQDNAGWARRSIETARKAADQLPNREQAMVRVHALRIGGEPGAAADSLGAYLERYPDDPEAWFWLADVLFHLRSEKGGLHGVADAGGDLWMFERAIELDSTFTPALIHPLERAFAAVDLPAVARHVATVERVPAGREAADVYRAAESALREPDDVDRLADALARAIRARGGPADLAWQAAGAVLVPLRRAAVTLPAARQAELLTGVEQRLGEAAADPLAHEVLLRTRLAHGDLDGVASRLRVLRDRRELPQRTEAGTRQLAVFAGLADTTFLASAEPARPHVRAAAALLHAIDRGDARGVEASLERLAREQAAAADDATEAAAADGARHRAAVAAAARGFVRVLQGDTVSGLADVRAALETVPFRAGLVEALWFRWLDHSAAHPQAREQAGALLEQPWPGEPLYEVLRLRAMDG